ncbi:MAG: hypothetical protein ACK53Y_17685, partial [bacterium]
TLHSPAGLRPPPPCRPPWSAAGRVSPACSPARAWLPPPLWLLHPSVAEACPCRRPARTCPPPPLPHWSLQSPAGQPSLACSPSRALLPPPHSFLQPPMVQT